MRTYDTSATSPIFPAAAFNQILPYSSRQIIVAGTTQKVLIVEMRRFAVLQVVVASQRIGIGIAGDKSMREIDAGGSRRGAVAIANGVSKTVCPLEGSVGNRVTDRPVTVELDGAETGVAGNTGDAERIPVGIAVVAQQEKREGRILLQGRELYRWQGRQNRPRLRQKRQYDRLL